MPSVDLNSELRRRAEETSEAVLSEAQAEADRLAAEADRLIAQKQEALLKSKEQHYRAEARTRIAAERHEAMRVLLLARTRLVERVLEEARSLLPDAVRSEAYLSTLADEVRNALGFVEGGGAVVRCSEALASVIREAVRGTPDIRVEVAKDAGSGFTALGQRDTVLIDGTLETRLERLTPTLAIEIHQRLEEL